jgi:hypothetical protein
MVELTRVVLEELIEESAGRIAERLDTLPERIRSSGTARVVASAEPFQLSGRVDIGAALKQAADEGDLRVLRRL